MIPFGLALQDLRRHARRMMVVVMMAMRQQIHAVNTIQRPERSQLCAKHISSTKLNPAALQGLRKKHS
jgi:hypothetical protein